MDELPRVDADFNKDVEYGDGGGVDGDEATVAEVHEEMHVKRTRRQVIDATGAVGNVAEDKTVCDTGESREDVGDDEREHQ